MMFALLLLILAGAQGNVGLDRNMPENHQYGTLISVLKEVGHSLECFGDIVHESLSSHAESRDTLQVFGDLLRQSLKANSHNSEAFAELGRLSMKVHELEANYSAKNEENLQNILKVEKYSETKEWEDLKQGLGEPAEASSVLAVLQARNITGTYISPLFAVACRGYAELVTLLLCHGLAVETSGYNRLTMLHGAAYSDQLRVAQLLVEAGADLESRDLKDRTPLMLAAAGGSLEVAQWLVKVGANPRLAASDGTTALDIAIDKGHDVVAEYLSSLDL